VDANRDAGRWGALADGTRLAIVARRSAAGGAGRADRGLAAKVADLERRLAKDSGTSSKPPSSDSPYTKKPKDRSLRGRSGRKPGKQPGAGSSALEQSGHPDHTVECGPATCGCCGTGLSGAPAAGMQKRQVFEAAPPPPPEVTEYQVQAKQCPECGEVSIGLAPDGVTGRLQYGPRVHASTALAVCANYLPVARAAKLVAALTGVHVSAGFTAGIRGKAAARLGLFTDRVTELLGAAAVLYADETPPAPPGNCTPCTWPAPSSSPPCTPAAGPRRPSTPAASWRATRARSSATGTPATTT
jgi:transposase